jgi:ribosomal protein S18 acetylase RimI-like enzyme
MKTIILNNKDGNSVQAELKVLDLNYLDEIMKLQDDIYQGLENKEFYSCSSRKEFQETIEEKGKVLGCVSLNDHKLLAIGVYVEYGDKSHNYGYDIDIQGNDILKVGQIESTLVSKDYRGNKLQKIICTYLEEIGRESGVKWICATVEPNNKYSLNTFKELGYKIVVEKLKYGGLRRYVLSKEL